MNRLNELFSGEFGMENYSNKTDKVNRSQELSFSILIKFNFTPNLNTNTVFNFNSFKLDCMLKYKTQPEIHYEIVLVSIRYLYTTIAINAISSKYLKIKRIHIFTLSQISIETIVVAGEWIKNDTVNN